MSKTVVTLGEMLGRDYVRNYVEEMYHHGLNRQDIIEGIAEILEGIMSDEELKNKPEHFTWDGWIRYAASEGWIAGLERE